MLSYYLTGFKKLLHIGKKIFLVLAVYFIVVSLFLHFIAKDKPKTTYDPIKKNREEIYKTINDPQLNKTQEGKLAVIFYRTMMCGLIGEACTDNPADGDKNFSRSLFGFVTNLLVLPYANPPASGVYWAYSGLQNAGFIPKTYAAEGIGFGSIKAFNKVWLGMRNFSFMFMVLVIITIGFMIMFRAKLNPQTVISIENALPKIVITLILINFSFAIAGFLIDLMYLSMALIISLLATASGLDQESTIGNYLTAGPWTIFDLFFPGKNFFLIFQIPINFINLFGWVGWLITAVFSLFLTIFVTFPYLLNVTYKSGPSSLIETILLFFLAPFRTFFIFLVSLILTPLVLGLIVVVLILLTIIFLFFRIIFTLISTYIKILLLILFSPLIILLNAIPGQSPFNFESWLKNLIGELITFPLIIFIFMVGGIIINALSSNEVIFTPPFLIGINAQSLIFIFGMGILYIIPDLIKIFKQLILPKPLPLPQAGPGVFFAGAKTAIGGALGEASKWGSIGMHVAPVRAILQKLAPGIFKYEKQ